MRVLTDALRDTTHAQPEAGPAEPCCPDCGSTDFVRLDALALLERMEDIRGLADELERVAVRQSRLQGASWATIGGVLGMTGQSAGRKFGG